MRRCYVGCRGAVEHENDASFVCRRAGKRSSNSLRVTLHVRSTEPKYMYAAKQASPTQNASYLRAPDACKGAETIGDTFFLAIDTGK